MTQMVQHLLRVHRGGGKLIKIKDVLIEGTLTYNNDGYVNIYSHLPSSPTGYGAILYTLKTWTSGTVYGVAHGYLLGEPNKTVTDPVVRVIYVKQGYYEVI